MKPNKVICSVFITILWFSGLPAQINAPVGKGKLEQFLNNPAIAAYELQYTKEVRSFYNTNGYRYSWLGQPGRTNLLLLTRFILFSPDQGLKQQDYQLSLLNAMINPLFTTGNEQDSLLAEIRITDIAIHFLHDVLTGNQPEILSYNGLDYIPACYDVPALLNAYLSIGRFSYLIMEQEQKTDEYIAVKSKLNHFQKIITKAGFKDAIVSSLKADSLNQPLLTRLYQLGIIMSDTIKLSNTAIKSKLKEAQELLGLFNDGTLKTETQRKLNIPLTTRISELESTLNSIRWLSCLKQSSHVIIVNIPSATLLIYEKGKVVLESRIVVGKRSTPTPTLSSKVTEVILYPYWNIPYKIATEELLPRVKRNPGYLTKNGYQVLNRNGNITDPSRVNWSAVSRGNFPYVFRQSTGCDNALGLIKLNFYNPFSVYLHDTPSKSLFKKNNRYFSHGCMRVQKAMEVGHYILKNNSIAIDTLVQKGCLRNQSPISVPASEVIPVFVLYHTAWLDAEGKLEFFEDVYDKLKGK